jgi:hypothetical protein
MNLHQIEANFSFWFHIRTAIIFLVYYGILCFSTLFLHIIAHITSVFLKNLVLWLLE